MSSASCVLIPRTMVQGRRKSIGVPLLDDTGNPQGIWSEYQSIGVYVKQNDPSTARRASSDWISSTKEPVRISNQNDILLESRCPFSRSTLCPLYQLRPFISIHRSRVPFDSFLFSPLCRWGGGHVNPRAIRVIRKGKGNCSNSCQKRGFTILSFGSRSFFGKRD